MTLIKSISGMRGTIGGEPGNNLTPPDIVSMTSAYAVWLHNSGAGRKVIIGRDGRISGMMVSTLVAQTLLASGLDVVDLGLSTTPTVEMAVTAEKAGGGIIITASHNPHDWNALKMLDSRGEFISAEAGSEILKIAEENRFNYAKVDALGVYIRNDSYISYHIDQILKLEYLDNDLVRKRNFKVAVDCINSTGALAIPPLLDRLNCEYTLLNAEITGKFAHDPEPLEKNLSQLTTYVKKHKLDLGIAVDPDVDRLVFACEDGSLFGEEYTLVAVADYILKHKKGHAVSNLSSTRALRDICEKEGVEYHAAAVGEVNVVKKMKEVNALIGGEGNGGVILPSLHYGRDALAGIALMLNHLATEDIKMSALRNRYPQYTIIKEKIGLNTRWDIDKIFEKIRKSYINEDIDTTDGLKIDFEEAWVHLRKSNTEPVMRIIAEAKTEDEARVLIEKIKKIVNKN